MKTFSVVIVGGGIVGLATALQLLRQRPGLKLAILEKESLVGAHQTGHNSGVIHSGIYYKPGSLKAQNCIAGAKELINFCKEQEINFELCGKVIVALTPEELPRLDELERRAKANGVVGLERIGPERLKEIEPQAVCLQALYSPQTGIVDFQQVAQAYAKLIIRLGGEIFFDQQVTAINRRADQQIVLQTQNQEFSTSLLINCAGLYSDRIARMIDAKTPQHRILPFRGEYYDLIPTRSYMINGLIYPVPDPKFPFLGVHVTRMITGDVEVGPNAVLAFAREGYSKWKVNLGDSADILGYKGFWSLAKQYWRVGMYEMYRSLVKNAFVKDVQRLVPAIQASDLVPGQSGVRAQVVTAEGKLLDDFLIQESPGVIHVLNAPSPAATASLSIGKTIARLALDKLSK